MAGTVTEMDIIELKFGLHILLRTPPRGLYFLMLYDTPYLLDNFNTRLRYTYDTFLIS